MKSEENAEYRKCGVWRMRSVENEDCGKWECSRENEDCGKCGVWKMRTVENVECGK